MIQWLTPEGTVPYEVRPVDPRYSSLRMAQADPQPVMTAEELMSTPVLTADVKWSPDRALQFMDEEGISHLPVHSGDRLVGLVSDRDLLVATPLDTSLESVMANRLLTARPESNLWTVARTMLSERIHCVLIVNDMCELQGVLTSLDLLGCMTHHAPYEVWG
jgi:CBS domain-containing protein